MPHTNLTSTTATITVPAGHRDPQAMARKAYAMMIDVESYPDFMPSVNALEILDRADNQVTTRWDAQIDGAPIQWVQRVWWTDADRKMHFEAVEGDFDVFQGLWSAGGADGQVHLQLRVEYRLGIPIAGYAAASNRSAMAASMAWLLAWTFSLRMGPRTSSMGGIPRRYPTRSGRVPWPSAPPTDHRS
jgi:ribosome-associated toxin RatA of RatAB toxin-antitoxin module